MNEWKDEIVSQGRVEKRQTFSHFWQLVAAGDSECVSVLDLVQQSGNVYCQAVICGCMCACVVTNSKQEGLGLL